MTLAKSCMMQIRIVGVTWFLLLFMVFCLSSAVFLVRILVTFLKNSMCICFSNQQSVKTISRRFYILVFLPKKLDEYWFLYECKQNSEHIMIGILNKKYIAEMTSIHDLYIAFRILWGRKRKYKMRQNLQGPMGIIVVTLS